MAPRDLESDPLLPQNENVVLKPTLGASTKLGMVALILAAASGVSYYRHYESTSTSLDSTSSTDDASSSSSSTMPHIVFMFVDDMGMNDIGYKSTDLAHMTPELNDLASSGIIFEKYYTMQLCTPARSALLTSKLPMKLGMQYENIHPDMPWGLPLSEAIMPQYLKKSGYRTYIVGKWNQGHYATEYLPTSRGFDSFTGYLSDEINYFTHEYPQPFGTEMFYDFQEGNSVDGVSPLSLSGTYSTEVYTDKISSLIKTHDAVDGEFKNSPMFLYYAAQSVHGPMDAPPLSILEESALSNLGQLGYSEGEHRLVFASILSALDTSVGQIKKSMIDAQIWDNSLFIVASDNGGCSEEGGSNAPLRGGKHWMFEGGVHVPAFMYSATLIPSAVQGTVFNQLFHVTDWMPTILSAIEAPIDSRPAAVDDIDGYDQWSNIIAPVEQQTQLRGDILIHLSSWTSCCADQSGNDQCTGFLSSCADSSSAVLTPLTKPRGAIISSNGYKLIMNEYEIPWYGIPTSGASTDDTSSDTEVVVPPRNLLSTDDATDDHPANVAVSKDSSGNPMNNCGSEPTTATVDYWLFDITNDPNETTNLYGTLPDIEADLLAKMDEYAKKEVKANWVNEDASAYAAWKANDGFITTWM